MEIYYDVSATFRNGLNTGIQRVVRSLAGEDHTDALTLILGDSRDPKIIRRIEREEFFGSLLKEKSNSKKFVYEYLVWLRKFRFLSIVVDRSRLGQNLKEWIQIKMSLNYTLNKEIEKKKAISIKAGDTYITFDAFWNSEMDIARILHAKKQGAKIVVFIHDILPLTNPEWFEAANIKNFRKYFPVGIENADILLFSSNRVLMEFNRVFKTSDQPKYKILLGSTHLRINTQKRIWRSDGIILMVGTIEPRKNYLKVLDWFETTDLPNKLIIVGRPGWKTTRIQITIRTLKIRRKKIFWIKKISDKKMCELFEQASVGICASLDEGYGLPLREFLSAGVPVVASDIPTFREIKTTNIEYFSPDSTRELQLAIRRIMKRGFTSDSMQLPGWENTYRTLMNLVAK